MGLTGAALFWAAGGLAIIVAMAAKPGEKGEHGKIAGIRIPAPRTRSGQAVVVVVGIFLIVMGFVINTQPSGPIDASPASSTSTSTPGSNTSAPTSGGSVHATPPDTSASAEPSEQPWPGEPDGVGYKTGTAAPDYSSLGADGSIDLDKGTSEYGSSSRSDLVAGTAGVGANHGAQIALWPEPEPPTLRDCRRLPSMKYGKTELIETVRFQSMTRYCVKSKEGRFGRIQTISTEVTSTETRYVLSYVLWKKPGDS